MAQGTEPFIPYLEGVGLLPRQGVPHRHTAVVIGTGDVIAQKIVPHHRADLGRGVHLDQRKVHVHAVRDNGRVVVDFDALTHSRHGKQLVVLVEFHAGHDGGRPDRVGKGKRRQTPHRAGVRELVQILLECFQVWRKKGIKKSNAEKSLYAEYSFHWKGSVEKIWWKNKTKIFVWYPVPRLGSPLPPHSPHPLPHLTVPLVFSSSKTVQKTIKTWRPRKFREKTDSGMALGRLIDWLGISKSLGTDDWLID